MIEQTSEKDIKQKQDNHNDEEIEIDWTETLHKIMISVRQFTKLPVLAWL